jgi:hypothetical protein
LALDSSNNAFVTGNAVTVKYDANGNQLWTAINGSALAVDSGGNVVVTGTSTNFGTVKLSGAGSNLWSASYSSPGGPGAGETVVIDSNNNSYVSGTNFYTIFLDGNETLYFIEVLTIEYGSNGNQIWTAANNTGDGYYGNVTEEGAVLDGANNLYILFNNTYQGGYLTLKYANNGSLLWTAPNPEPHTPSDMGHGLVLDQAGDVLVTGQNYYIAPNLAYATYTYGTYRASTNGLWVFTNSYPSIPSPNQPSVATSIAVDSANNYYVTGYSPGTNSGKDIVTIKYDPNGNQVWLQRYNGLGNGNDAGNAIAVDNNGNVYVTGYETLPDGGTGIVTIKYAPVTTLQRRSDGAVILQAQGSPGESFDVQASADLQSWLDLGDMTADTNGVAQFTDTNAPNYPARFYLTSPQ